MKKVLKTIAMILVVAIIANSVTSCLLLPPLFGGKFGYSSYGQMKKIAMGFDGTILVVSIIIAVVTLISYGVGRAIAQPDAETPPMAINAASGNHTYVFSNQIEHLSFRDTLSGLPKAQIDTLTEKVQAVPEAEINSLMETFNAIPQTNMIPIMDELNALSETEISDTVGYLNSLSETQFIALLRKIQDKTEYAAAQ